ncbi:MAG: patatin-like phospholipase family protein [Bacteroidales bacterium]|nr:patatin-like phospholipase family protein [Bacteroidales bacterium]
MTIKTFIDRPLLSAVVVLLCWISIPVHGQNNLSSISVDPEADSIAIMKMRHNMDSIRQYRPTVAVVLAGGGAKGAAHVGVLKYIYELGIPVDMVLGTSMGGLMGGLIAMGYSPEAIDSILVHTDWRQMMSDLIPGEYLSYERKQYREKYRLAIPFHYENQMDEDVRSLLPRASSVDNRVKIMDNIPDGYVYGYNVNNIISALTVGYQDSLDFTSFPVPYCCVSTDMVSMKAKYWTSGRIGEAMRATMSIPGYFRPVRTDEMVHIDGGTRNNFPSDMARAMGADFVIGVDLSWPNDKDHLNSLASILHQGIILMGKEALERNQQLVDVYIHPDVRHTTMMSFDDESISGNIRLGYESAKEQHDKLVSIVAEVGRSDTRVLNNTPAIDLAVQPVLISDVTYEGVGDDMAVRFRSFSEIVPGEKYGRKEIEKELASIYGTKMFEEVSYMLEGTCEPYRLIIHCKQGPVHQFGASVRFDSGTKVSAALNIGLNKNKIQGPQADITAVIGNNPSLDLDLRYMISRGPVVGVDLFTHFIDNRMLVGETDIYKLGIQIIEQGYRSWNHRARLYVSPYTGYHSFLKGGLSYDVTPLEEIRYFIDEEGYLIDSGTWKRYKWNMFLNAGLSTLDNKYFPRKGFSAQLDYRFMFRDSTADKSNHYHILYAGIKGVIPIGNRFAVIPEGYFYSTQSADLSSLGKQASPALSDDLTTSYVGGMFEGQLFRYQMPYFGYSVPHVNQMSNTSAMVNIFFRYTINQRLYLNLVAAGYKNFFEVSDDGSTVYGIGQNLLSDYSFGCRIGHDSRIGPVSLDVFWSSCESWGIRFKAGFDF